MKIWAAETLGFIHKEEPSSRLSCCIFKLFVV